MNEGCPLCSRGFRFAGPHTHERMEAGALMSDELTCDLIVTVRLYGRGTADDAAQALREFRSTFELPGNPRVDEVEIIDARPVSTPVS